MQPGVFLNARREFAFASGQAFRQLPVFGFQPGSFVYARRQLGAQPAAGFGQIDHFCREPAHFGLQVRRLAPRRLQFACPSRGLRVSR